MAAPPRFTTHRFAVIIGDPDDEATLREFHVVAVGRDIQRVEAMFAQNGWGGVDKRPITAAAAMAWAALTRTGAYPGTFAEFEAEYIEVTPEGAVVANPTDGAPGTG